MMNNKKTITGTSRRAMMPKAKRNVLTLAVMMLLCFPAKMAAQGEFIFGAECISGNIWSASLFNQPTDALNAVVWRALGIVNDTTHVHGGGYTFRFNSIKNNGQKMQYDGNHFFGLGGEDLFRDLEYSIKFGWRPAHFPVGAYLQFGYRREEFSTRMSDEESWTNHRINYWRPGVGFRIAPFDKMLEKYKVCPIAEVGCNYDWYFNYRGAYDNAKDQLNNGVSYNVAIGFNMASRMFFMFKFEHQLYDLFNQDFTVAGIKPYKDVTTNHSNFSIVCNFNL